MSADDEQTTVHVRRARCGDESSIDWLVRRFTPWLIEQARYRLTGPLRRLQDPDDLVQSTWAVAVVRLPDIRAVAGRSTPVFLRFLARTLTGHLLNVLRTEARRSVLGATPASPIGASSLPAETIGVVERAILAEESQLLREALDRLDPGDRELIILRGLEARSYDEIGVLMGVPATRLRMRFIRARSRLAELLPSSFAQDLGEL